MFVFLIALLFSAQNYQLLVCQEKVWLYYFQGYLEALASLISDEILIYRVTKISKINTDKKLLFLSLSFQMKGLSQLSRLRLLD